MAAPPCVQARYPRAEELFDDLHRQGPNSLLFVRTGRKFTLGQALVVVVDLPVERRSFRLHGRVIAARRGSREPPLPAGIEVELGSDQQRTLQLALDCAEGKRVDFVERSSKRVPCSVEVVYRSDAGFVREFAEDISEGGTFVRAERLYPVGTELECKLLPPGYLLGVKLRGRVAWVRESGPQRGMGIAFVFENARQTKRIRVLCRRLQAEHSARVERGVEAFKRRDRSRSRAGR